MTITRSFVFLYCLLMTDFIFSQVPQKINYQAVARDNSGNPIIKKAISLRLSILNGSASGSSVYSEVHKVTTNDYGHFSVMIGGGTGATGVFKDISWDVSDKYLKIEFDPNGASSYTNMGTVQLISVPYALNAYKANSLSASSKILLDQIDAGGATSGQVIGWDGTKWIPVAKGGGGGSDNWGTQVAQTDLSLAGDGTAGNPLKLGQRGATNGQILKWNGVAWLPANESGGSDNWGSQVAQTNGTISGNGTAASPLAIAQQSAVTNQILRWDGSKWSPSNESPGSDNWGTQTAVTSSTLTGNGTASNPLNLAQQSATAGQVLKWNGSGWVPMNDSTGSDNWGSQSVVSDSSLMGLGTSSNPLKLAQRGATSGQFLQWNGTAWVPVTATTGGDNWGSQVAMTNSTLSGSGTSSNPLRIAPQGATSGQILQYNGSDWVPATATTGGDNWGSQSVQVNSSLAGNGTASNPLKLAQQSATSGQFLQWNTTANNWIPVTLTAPNGDNWGTQSAVTSSALTGNGTASSPLNLAAQSATNGQVLKWNGTAWVPKNDSAGGTYTATNGITISGSTIQLGGTLTGTTTITTSASNTLAIAGLQSSSPTDSILTINPSSNVIRRMDASRLGGGGHWTKDAVNNLSYKNGMVSVGTDTARNLFYVYNNSSALDTSVYVNSTTSSSSGNIGIVADAFSTSANASVGGRFTGNAVGAIGVGRQTLSAASNITGVIGAARSSLGSSRLDGIHGEADPTSGPLSFGVSGFAYHAGVFGSAGNSGNVLLDSPTNPYLSKYGVLGLNSGASASNVITWIGTGGMASNSNAAQNIGVLGASNSPVGSQGSIGVYGRAIGGDTFQIGVLGEVAASVRSSNRALYAGYFNWDVNIDNRLFVGNDAFIDSNLIVNDTIYANKGLVVTGFSRFNDSAIFNGGLSSRWITKGGGTFKIDHPQDPENKYLVHSFVESPDMMNVYNGNVVTDKNGFATVTLPEYFMSLNRDFRYQLTAIGEFSQVIVKNKIMDNQFTIQSEKRILK